MYWALFYEVVPDYVARRQPFRAAHLALAEKARAEGKLVLAGAFDPPDGALLVFRGRGDAEAFVRGDPYVANGLVTAWRVKGWNVVVGEGVERE